MGNRILKFVISGLVLVAVAVGVLFLVDYIRYRKSPEYRAMQELQELERRYREDPYGGSTPEETLQLFIDALKKGDVELASKYFVLDVQENKLKYLREIKEGNNLSVLINELSFSYTKRSFGGSDSHYIMDIYNPQDDTHIQFDVAKSPNGLWKVVDL